MKKPIVLIILLLSSAYIFSQENDPAENNSLQVAFVPSAFLNVWTGYQGKLEYEYKNNFAININCGYLYGKRSNELYKGVRIRPSVRYYFNSSSINDYRSFVGIGYLYRNTTTGRTGSIIKGGGQYFERVKFDSKNTLQGIYIMAGSRTYFSNRFWLEGAIGLGPGRLSIKNEGLPIGSELLENERFIFFNFNRVGDRGMGVIIMHVSIGMRIF